MRISFINSVACIAVALAVILWASIALAAGSHGHGHGGATGEQGDPAEVTTTIEITMFDNYYEPEEITVREGETVRFIVTNKGEFVHEFNIATAEMHAAHSPEMQMMIDHGVLEPDRINRDAAKAMQESMGHGMHDEPNSVLLEPGQTAELVWRFSDAGVLEFACNIPGHYDSGMMGEIDVTH